MKLVQGVGINDADYVVLIREELARVNGKRKFKFIWVCPYYNRWKSMLKRCYSLKWHILHPTYKDCSVCEEWLTFSNFRSWMETQDWEGKQLDKDILFPSNKVYSPETCVFVSQKVNNFIIDSGAVRGRYKIGVTVSNRSSKFQARCNNPFTGQREDLGLFEDEWAAFNAWLSRKREFATLLAAEQEDTRVAEAILARYTNYE